MKVLYRLLIAAVVFTIAEFAKYEVELERIAPYVEPDLVLDLGTLRIKKFNRSTYVFNGNYTMLRPLGPDITITLVANSMQGGEYRKLAEKTINDVCVNALSTEQAKPYYEEVNEVSNMPPWKTCPFPAGTYYINNYLLVDRGGVFPETIPAGEKYRIDAIYKIGNDPKPVGGYRLFVKFTKILV